MESNVLKAQMILKSKSINDVISKLGISKSAFYRKLNGQSEFNRKEICSLIEILQIDDEDAIKIFFG